MKVRDRKLVWDHSASLGMVAEGNVAAMIIFTGTCHLVTTVPFPPFIFHCFRKNDSVRKSTLNSQPSQYMDTLCSIGLWKAFQHLSRFMLRQHSVVLSWRRGPAVYQSPSSHSGRSQQHLHSAHPPASSHKYGHR